MDQFIEFDQDVSMEQLRQALAQHNPGIMILRYSKLTGTVKVRSQDDLSKRDLKRAFKPFKIKKIYSDFPMKSAKL